MIDEADQSNLVNARAHIGDSHVTITTNNVPVFVLAGAVVLIIDFLLGMMAAMNWQ